MTNYERWLSYTSPLPSPDNYIRWGWLYLISASLQRRVWCPPNHDRVYPNMFVTLVGDPGVGKGGPIRAVKNILTQHKLEVNGVTKKLEGASDDEKFVAHQLAQLDVKNAEDVLKTGADKQSFVPKPLLIPVAADAVTYEALVQSMARSYRHINVIEWDEKAQKKMMKAHGHSSLAFCLEEISSLFRKRTEDVVNFLIQAYDCGEEYEKKTKTAGDDRIRRVCLNFFGGTTPDFMQSTFDEKLTNQGYSSRTFYIFALKNRKTIFFRDELSPEQIKHRDEIAAHVKALTELYGQVTVSAENFQYLDAWFREYMENPSKWGSRSAKLKAYYARKNIHVMKVAMALHFGESLDMEIKRETFDKAIEILHEEEKTMHLALMVGNNNPLARVSNKIYDYLRDTGARTFTNLLAEFWDEVREAELTEVLDYLRAVDKISVETRTDEVTKENDQYYKAR